MFGDDVLTRIKTCEFHFRESRNKMARKLNDDAGKVFKELCNQSLKTTYLNAKKYLKNLLKQSLSGNF